MTTKTDLAGISLTASELSALHGKAINGPELLLAAKEGAAELATLIGELLKFIPAGANATTLTNIRAALL